jgi:hypothetical protein
MANGKKRLPTCSYPPSAEVEQTDLRVCSCIGVDEGFDRVPGAKHSSAVFFVSIVSGITGGIVTKIESICLSFSFHI